MVRPRVRGLDEPERRRRPLGAGVVGAIVAHSVPGAFLFGAGLAVFAGIWPIVFPFNVPAPRALSVEAALAEG